MSAAFLMATTQLLVRTTLARFNEPAKCMTEVNRQLCTQVFNGQFVTMQILVIDPSNRTVDIATAGHPAPLLAEAESSSSFQPVPLEPQMVLGVDPDAMYETERFELPPGAALLLYTDGAADVEAPDGRRLGNEGLRRVLPSSPGRRGHAQLLLESVVTAVNTFRGARSLGDDLTLVAIRLHAEAPAPTPEPEPEAAAA